MVRVFPVKSQPWLPLKNTNSAKSLRENEQMVRDSDPLFTTINLSHLVFLDNEKEQIVRIVFCFSGFEKEQMVR